MVFIYVLQLEDNKYYVGKTNNPVIRLTNHFELTGSAWTKKYKPIQIYAIIPDCDNYDEDKYTKIYMEKFGINNVRGGSYCSTILSDEVKKIIQLGINSSNDKCYKCNQSGHFAKDCLNIENIEPVKKSKIYNCNYCNKECENYEYLQEHLKTWCKKKVEPVKQVIKKVIRVYSCNYCKKECESYEYLQEHIKTWCKKKIEPVKAKVITAKPYIYYKKK